MLRDILILKRVEVNRHGFPLETMNSPLFFACVFSKGGPNRYICPQFSLKILDNGVLLFKELNSLLDNVDILIMLVLSFELIKLLIVEFQSVLRFR